MITSFFCQLEDLRRTGTRRLVDTSVDDKPVMVQLSIEKKLLPNRIIFKGYLDETHFDDASLTILKRSTLQKLDSNIADVFVPTIPFSRLVCKENSGHGYVFIGTSFCLFRRDCRLC